MKSKNFRDLKVWQLGQELVLEIYRLTGGLPDEERFGLIAQMRRAAISIPSNIAEGFNRYHNKDYRKFLFVSLGSCAELETQLEIAERLDFVRIEQKEIVLDMIDHESRMLRKLIETVSISNEIRDTRNEIRSNEY